MFNNIYKNKKVIITGNTGFKGAWLTTWLLKLGANVYGLSKDIPTKPSLYEALKLNSKIQHTFGDIRNYEVVNKLFSNVKPDFIFHLAAQPIVSSSFDDPIETFETNVIGSVNVLQAFKKLNYRSNLIFITSDKCYENVEWTYGYREIDSLGGKDPYSASKACAELAFSSFFRSFINHDKNKKAVSARAGNVIGGGDWALNRIVPDAMVSWSNSKSVEIRSPKATRPWQHVLEPLSGYLRLGQLLYLKNNSLSGESFNFGPAYDQNKTVLELLKKLGDQWKSSNNQLKTDILINTPKDLLEANLLKLNCDKALHNLNWKPVLDFKSTIQFTGDWYYEFYFNKNNEKLLFDYTKNQIELYEQKAKEQSISWAKSKK